MNHEQNQAKNGNGKEGARTFANSLTRSLKNRKHITLAGIAKGTAEGGTKLRGNEN
jgi:hypothetical protein